MLIQTPTHACISLCMVVLSCGVSHVVSDVPVEAASQSATSIGDLLRFDAR